MATDLLAENPGELSTEVLPAMHVEWKVRDTLLLSQETEHEIDSPSFQFEDATWYLRVTVENKKLNSWFCIDSIYLKMMRKEWLIPDQYVTCHFGVKKANGETYAKDMSKNVFKASRSLPSLGSRQLLYRRDLERKNDLVSKGLITFFCTFWVHPPSSVNADSKGEVSECQLPNAYPAELSTQIVPVTYVEWRIQAALLRPQETNHTIDSPSFQFRDGTCCLRATVVDQEFYGEESDDEDTMIYLDLSPVQKDSVAPETHTNCLAAIMGACSFNSYDWNYGQSHDVKAMKYRIYSGGINNFNAFLSSSGLVTFSSYFWVDNAEESNADLKMDLSQGLTNEATSTSQASDSSCSGRIFIDTEKLLNDFKNLFISGEDSDVVITVKATEFRAHRNILRARSSVLNSMFRHDMLEKNNNVVDITDCEPDAFKVFLLYLYTGSIENLSTDIVFNLYRVADKYDAGRVREECRKFMVSSLSVDTVCDVVEHALLYDDAELLKTATNFFIKNFKEVILTVKWQNFLKKNAVTANELFIKISERYVLRD